MARREAVRVCARVRPRSVIELAAEDEVVVSVQDRAVVVNLPGASRRAFNFDVALDQEAQQGEVFEACGRDIAEHLIDGFNSCLFVYGQTGAGKSHTILGGEGAPIGPTLEAAAPPPGDGRGLLPRIIV